MAYLDDTGLAHFWDKIKQWIASAASNLVHRTGDETVAGVKTFDRTTLDGSHWCQQQLQVSSELDISVPSYPSTTRYGGLAFTDKDGDETGAIYQLFEPSGLRRFRIRNFDNSSAGHDYFELVYDPATGDEWAQAPDTLASRSNGNDIVTRNWIPQDTRIVHTTGAESISGIKSFNSKVNVETNAWLPVQLRLPNVNYQSSTYPSSTVYTGIGIIDAGDHYPGDFYYAFNPDGSRQWVLRLIKDDGVATSGFRVNYVPGESDCYATIPTAALTEDSTRMPNTYWVRRATGNFACNAATATKLATARTVRTNLASTSTASFDGSANITPGVTGTLPVANGGTGLTSLDTFVRTTGNQSISGVKTFVQSIRVATNASGDNTYSLISNESNYGSWNFAANQWLWYTPHSSSLLYFYRALYVYGDLHLEGASRSIVIKETDFNATASGASGWAEIKHQDKNDVVNSRIIFTGEGNKYSRILFYAKRKNSTTAWTGVGLFDEDSNRRLFMPSADTSDNALELGGGGNRWKVVYAATGSINTSDERLKLGISSIPDAVLDAWMDSDFLQFRFTDAVEEKGDGARLHTGMVAQRIASAFAARGLDASRYGLFCYDSWSAEPAMVNDDGEVVSPAREAGDRYSLRYEEALCMEAACMRRENARLKKRVADLEERLAALELRLGSE